MATQVARVTPAFVPAIAAIPLGKVNRSVLKPNASFQGTALLVPGSGQLFSSRLCSSRPLFSVRAEEGGKGEKTPTKDEYVPDLKAMPWIKSEGGATGANPSSSGVPFYVYLLASGVVAIAAVGSVFEYLYKNPVFGVLGPDSPLYPLLLGWFVFTGFPLSAWLWIKSTEAYNAQADREDSEDGY
eukprot:jgi/Mesvir1/19150/Mv01173-RA.1